jgi:hypothetical protein
VAPAATATYTLTGSNQYGAGNTASITVTVIQPVPVNTCASQSLANIDAQLDWGSGNLKYFQISAYQSYSFSTEIIGGPIGGTITTVYGGNQKLLSLSTNKCDFSPALITSHCMTAGNDPVLSYSTNPGAACKLEIGKAYYINVRNAVLDSSGAPIQPIQDSCAGLCQFAMQY